MTTEPIGPTSTVMIPYKPISYKSHLESIINDIFKRSLNIAKIERDHLCPVPLESEIILALRKNWGTAFSV